MRTKVLIEKSSTTALWKEHWSLFRQRVKNICRWIDAKVEWRLGLVAIVVVLIVLIAMMTYLPHLPVWMAQ
ncbi:MAG TPA: hypothetical protein VF974_02065 [Patescibacteria group bacterium]